MARCGERWRDVARDGGEVAKDGGEMAEKGESREYGGTRPLERSSELEKKEFYALAHRLAGNDKLQPRPLRREEDPSVEGEADLCAA